MDGVSTLNDPFVSFSVGMMLRLCTHTSRIVVGAGWERTSWLAIKKLTLSGEGRRHTSHTTGGVPDESVFPASLVTLVLFWRRL